MGYSAHCALPYCALFWSRM